MEKKTESAQKTAVVSRREFLYLTSMSAAGMAVGCAVNPVTGEKQFMLVSESQEIQIDRQHSPHQLSTDYGTLQDRSLSAYIDRVGKTLVPHTHRKQMPYAFKGVNAVYVNAYAFPGGTIATTRGILLKLQNEAELAALLGHELGHINARHTARQMSKSQATSALVGVGQILVGMKYEKYAGLAGQLGMMGAGMLLASYSRENEREADGLGNVYMVKSGYNTMGFVGLMNMLKKMSAHKTGAVELLFSTHPMSSERYRAAVDNAQNRYQTARNLPMYRDRYMDNTRSLRRIKDAVEALQKGEGAMGQNQFDPAETHIARALKTAPDDYTGLLMMAKCKLAREKASEAERYVEKARQVNPDEAQAFHVNGFVKIKRKKYDAALREFSGYDRLLPGNPNTLFFKGLAYEGKQRKPDAANHYKQFLQAVNQGPQAEHAFKRLTEWGYVKKNG